MGQRLAQAREWAAVAVSARARAVGEMALVVVAVLEWVALALVELAQVARVLEQAVVARAEQGRVLAPVREQVRPGAG